jgi:putative glutamine amidotransferase
VSVPPTASSPPRIVVTVAVPGGPGDPDLGVRKRSLYEASMSRQGASPIMVDAATEPGRLAEAFAAMDGLLLGGGADLHPARYGRTELGSTAVEPARDALEADAWAVAQERGLPVLGICRGFQAINVFSGGSLLQHVDGHLGPGFGTGPAKIHPVRVAPGTRLARILFPTNAGGGVLRVNSYHHQAVRASDLAPGLLANAWASSPAGDLIEGLEAADGRFVFGLQCHPERSDSTPAAFERLFRVFVDAARGPADRR